MTDKETADNAMTDTPVSIEVAAQEAYDILKIFPWLISVGVSDGTIYVYIRRGRQPKPSFVGNKWKGYPVKFRKIYPPKAAV